MPLAKEGGMKVPNARKGFRKETPAHVSSSESSNSSSSSGEEESNQPPIKHLQTDKWAKKRKVSVGTKPTRKHKDRTPGSDEYDERYESDEGNDSDEGKKPPPRKKAFTHANANTTTTRPTGKSKGPGRGKGKAKVSEARESLFMTADLQ
ncbi:hypothetical protein SGCOL_003555 [Colletotrichum sp. CLE4]